MSIELIPDPPMEPPENRSLSDVELLDLWFQKLNHDDLQEVFCNVDSTELQQLAKILNKNDDSVPMSAGNWLVSVIKVHLKNWPDFESIAEELDC